MNKKYIDFYKKFIRHSKTVSDSGIKKDFSVGQKR